MPDLSRYDKYRNLKGPSDDERHRAYKNTQHEFVKAPEVITSGGNLLRVPPRMAKHHRIVVAGLRINK